MHAVCNGDQLEFACMIIDHPGHGSFSILIRNVTLITDDAAALLMSYTREIISSSPSDQTACIVANTTRLTFSRISAQNSYLDC